LKLVREHIFEKFEEKSDPIKDMGIGLFSKRTFNSYTDLYKFLADNLTGILDTKDIPKDILNSPENEGWFIKKEYNEILNDYIKKYLSVNDQLGVHVYLFPERFHDFLHKYFYPKLKSWKYEGKGVYGNKKHVYPQPGYMLKKPNRKIQERFEEESDPIRDMGIGELYTEKHFDTIEEAVDYLIDIIPTLFKVENAYDILSSTRNQIFKSRYYRVLDRYIYKYIFVKKIYDTTEFHIEITLAKKLKKLKEKKK
jgi:hypothetical protein